MPSLVGEWTAPHISGKNDAIPKHWNPGRPAKLKVLASSFFVQFMYKNKL